jgi:hypothetical protein
MDWDLYIENGFVKSKKIKHLKGVSFIDFGVAI